MHRVRTCKAVNFGHAAFLAVACILCIYSIVILLAPSNATPKTEEESLIQPTPCRIQQDDGTVNSCVWTNSVRSPDCAGWPGVTACTSCSCNSVIWSSRHHIHFGAELRQLGDCSSKLAFLGVNLGPTSNSAGQAKNYAEVRQGIYDRMVLDLQHKGLQLGGVITQGLSQTDLFTIQQGLQKTLRIKPILRQLEIPVRAVILPVLDRDVVGRIQLVIRNHLLPLAPTGAIWVQDPQLLHATIYHASSHAKPLPATSEQVQVEAGAVRAVASSSCPMHAVIDRIVITSSGVVMACWQVLPNSTEPAVLRDMLRAALPASPPLEAQMVREPAILHTTLARLLSPLGQAATPSMEAAAAAANAMTTELCGLTAVFPQLWFVEELELLALALQGHFKKHIAPLSCPSTQAVPLL